MGTRKVELGGVGHAVVAQVRRLRERRRLSLQALSDRLAALGRPILPSGLSKIEAGTRRVDVDDLVALADALETVPSALLLDFVDDRVKIADPVEYQAAIDAAATALRRCEAAGASRYELVELLDQVDRLRPVFELGPRHPEPIRRAAAEMSEVIGRSFALQSSQLGERIRQHHGADVEQGGR